MPLHKHFQTVIHAAADKIPPIIFPSLVNLISTILYKSQKKSPVCYPASYLFRLVINVQEKRTSSLYKIITHNYSHNSSLWQIPSPRPVVLGIWSSFYLTSLNFNDTINRKNTTKGANSGMQSGAGRSRNDTRAPVHNLAKESNLKFFNHSSYLWAVVGADMTAMKYWVSLLCVKRGTSSGSVCNLCKNIASFILNICTIFTFMLPHILFALCSNTGLRC